jgi:PAS domain S-box-containing protein
MLDCCGRIAESNPTLRRLFGGDGAGLVGRPLLGQVAGFAGIEAQIERRGWCRLQAAWRRQDGRLIWCDCIVTPILRADGRPRGYASVIRDITDEHRQMQERIKIGLPGCGGAHGGAP